MTTTAKSQELKHRVEAKRHELQAELNELRDKSKDASTDAIETAQKKLDEAETLLKDGWENLQESTLDKLNNWLSDDTN